MLAPTSRGKLKAMSILLINPMSTVVLGLASASSAPPANPLRLVESRVISGLMGLQRPRQARVLDAFIAKLPANDELVDDVNQVLPALSAERIDLDQSILHRLLAHEPLLLEVMRSLIPAYEMTDADDEYGWEGDVTRWAASQLASGYGLFGPPKNYTEALKSRRKKLSRTNPILQLIQLETRFTRQEEAKKARTVLNNVFTRMREILKQQPLSPRDSLLRTNLLLKQLNLKVIRLGEGQEGAEHDLFTRNLIRGTIDCDDICFNFLALGHEFGWPIQIGLLHGHSVIIWHANHGPIVLDDGEIHELKDFEKIMGESVMLLSDEQVLGMFYFNRARVLQFNLDEDDLEEAVESYTLAIEKYGLTSAAAYLNRGSAYYELERYNEAITDLDEVLRQKPDNADARLTHGRAHYELKNDTLALADLHEVLANQKETGFSLDYRQEAITYMYLGLIAHRHQKDLKQALSWFDKAIALDRMCLEAYFNRGTVHMALESYDQALADLSIVVRDEPEDVTKVATLIAISHVLVKLNRAAEAEPYLEAARKLDPERIRKLLTKKPAS